MYIAGSDEHDPLQPSASGTSVTRPSSSPSAPTTERTPLPAGIGLPGPRRRPPAAPPGSSTSPATPTSRAREVAAEVGLRGAFSFPIPVGDDTFAVIECFSLQAVTPDDRLLEVTAHIGRQLGRQIASLQLADALRESENRFRSVAESATDAIVAADQNGDIISWNRGAELMFGYGEDEVVGQPLSILMPERFRPMHDAGIARVAEGGMAASRLIGQTVEVVGLRKDGREFPLELSLAMWETAGDALLQRHHPRHLRAQEGRGEAQGRPRDRAGPDRRGRRRTARSCSPTRGPTSSSATTASRSSAARSRSSSPSAPARSSPSASRAVLQSTASDSQVALGMGLELWGQRKDGTEFPVDVTLSAAAHRRRRRRHRASSATSPSASASRTSCSTWPTTTR